MTCKECGHYEVCEYCSITNKTMDRDCRAFIDASKLITIPKTGIGDLSDGYHTFNELYHHRAVLFSVICNIFPDKAWKSRLHDTGDMFEGMFIVGIETPEGQATYHYNIDPYWDMFRIKEFDRAPIWDGHTPEEAINRISKLVANTKSSKPKNLVCLPVGRGKPITSQSADQINREEFKYGSWRLETDEECPNPMFKLVICSNCNQPANEAYKFCPHCGCVMTGLTTEGVNFG